MNLSFPWPNPNLSPNARSRTHWKRTRAIKAYRTGCGWEAKTQGARRIDADSLTVVITFHPPDRRHRDRDNMIASITSHEELDGYEEQAKTRGITMEEVWLIAEKRKALG